VSEERERTVEYFASRAATKRRDPPKPSQRLVERWAHAYVNRYYSPEASLRATLERRIRRGCAAHGHPTADAMGWADSVIATLKQAGIVDDQRWAADKARALSERGVPLRGIQQRLRVKGLSAEHITSALAGLKWDRAGDAVDVELQAALAYARRRRFGPFRRDPAERRERFQKDLAAMARAGHGYGLAKQVLEAEDAATLIDGDAHGAPW